MPVITELVDDPGPTTDGAAWCTWMWISGTTCCGGWTTCGATGGTCDGTVAVGAVPGVVILLSVLP